MVGQTTLTDGQWHHLAIVLPECESPCVPDIEVYVDGRNESSSVFLDAPIDTLSDPNVRFGMRAGDTWTPFDGLLDEVRIDSDALTPEEIAGWAVVIDIEESGTKSLKMKECYRFNQKEML